MRTLVLPCLLCFSSMFSQSYESFMQDASKKLKAKEYCAALSDFKNAFGPQAKVGVYEYVSGASAAANCSDTKTAVEWLKKSYELGLGKNRDEIIYLKTNERFKNLTSDTEFQQIITGMENKLAQKEEDKRKEAELWNQEIIRNQITENKPFNQPSPGFALYFTETEGMKIPYIVFVPKSYKASAKTRVIFYLHGGVNSLNDFYYKNTDVKTEPIFSVGENFNAIIVYPFAKKDFGWVDQKKAFENIFTIVHDIEKKYNVDRNKIYLGGMSNGGTATFWFASQKKTPFRAFYAFAPNPVLNIGDVSFENITKKHPLYTVNAKDDGVFSYENVYKIYNQNKSKATGWTFKTLEKGSHAFIYNPEINKELLTHFFSEVLK